MSKRSTVSVTIEPGLRRYVERRIRNGEFDSLDEALAAGLRSLKESEKRRRETVAWLRQEVAIGTAQADRGELLDSDEVFREIRAASAGRRRKSG